MPTLRIENIQEFTRRTEDRDFEICQHIYTAVQKAMTKKMKAVKVFDLVLETDPSYVYAFSLDRSQWKQALQACLEAYTREELYEDCSKIKLLLESIEDKGVGSMKKSS